MRKDMSKKKKSSLLLIAFLVVMAVSVSVISYSIATRESRSKDIQTDIKKTAASIGGDMDYITNIDRIIENSYLTNANGTPKEEAYYNIVEIVPDGVGSSGLEDYITSKGFKTYVIDANKETAANGMKDGMIRYDRLNVKNDTSLASVADTLNRADLIYVSSPQYTSYKGTLNMSEEVFNWLYTYSLNDYKPIIMDYVRPYQPTALTYESYAYEVARNHIKYRTFFWDFAKSPEPEKFFKAQSVVNNDKNYNISFYLPFNVDNNVAKGNVLVITNGAHPMEDALQSYDVAAFKENAYFGTESKKPGSISFVEMTPAQIDADTNILTKGNYDFIVIENDTMQTVMSADAYAKLKALSVTSQYIIYDKANVPDDEDKIDINSSNYLKLMDLLISNKGVARYTNVLPVSYGFFNALNDAGAEGRDAAKQIADLINYSDYRGSMSSGNNGKLYRVLELQPCYPIDLDVAAKRPTSTYDNPQYNGGPFVSGGEGFKGDYYTNPRGVLRGVSEDQVDGNTEYYKFELSKAKIAKALGLKYSQIRLDQMSTEEFISDKNVVLETYDLVYIGGNATALTPRSLMAPYGLTKPGIPGAAYDYFPVFDMYTHTGYPVLLQASPSYGGPGTDLQSYSPYGVIKEGATYVPLNGNDLTVIKYNELKNYIDAGMPIVFSDVVSREYDNMAKQQRLVQLLKYHSIDPDSNMFALLAYAREKNKKADSSVLWNFDISPYEGQTDYNFNANNQFGPALKPYVTLFKEKPTADLGLLVKNSSRRPNLKINAKPKDYIEGYESSYNVNENGTLTISASAVPTDGSKQANFTLQLLIDLDGNGSFSASELAAEADYTYVADAEESSVDLHYTFADPKFFGLVHWKVIAKQTGGKGECDVATGYAYYMRHEEDDKKEVNILQIMPRNVEANPNVDTGQMDGHTLYLCTECQMAKYRANYNIMTQNDPLLQTSGFKPTLEGHDDIEMGLHQHKFGIVKYDTAGKPNSPYDVAWAPGGGAEDWDSNFADLLAEDYEFNMDIVYLDELEKYTSEIAGQSDDDRLGFENDLDAKREAWENAKEAVEISGIKTRMNEFLEGLKGSGLSRVVLNNIGGQNITTTLTDTIIDQWIAHEAYYRAFWFLKADSKEFNEFKKLYADWVELHDPVVSAYNEYRECKRKVYSSSEWLYKNYDVVVLGFAENFGGRDLTVPECTDIKSFVDKGGTLLTTHDSTTRYSNMGSINLTTQLRETFGMDRFHMTADQSVSGDAKWTEYESMSASKQDKITEVYFSGDASSAIAIPPSGQYRKSFGPIKIGNKNLIVKIITKETDADGNNVFVEEVGNEVAEGQQITITVKLYDTLANYNSNTQYPIYPYQSSYGLFGGINAGQASLYAGTGGSNNDIVFNGPGLVSIVEHPEEEAPTEDPVYDLPAVKQEGTGGTPSIYQTFTVNKVEATTEAASTEATTEATTEAASTEATTEVTTEATTATTEATTEAAIDTETPPVTGINKLGAGEDDTATTPDGTDTGASEEETTATDTGASEDGTDEKETTASTEAPTESPKEETTVKLPPTSPIYFMTSKSVFEPGRGQYTGPGQGWLWETKLKNYFAKLDVISPVGVTDSTAVFETRLSTTPYLYAETSFGNNAGWNTSVWDDFEFHNSYNIGGTNRASRNNTGIITTYPFTLGAELKIAKTHAQSYALDLEDEGIAVWYSLAGCDGNLAKIRSSMFAASPRDGMDSYFLYSYSNGKGNVNYCGAGHSCVTGVGRDNNDERRLYINLIVNAVRNKASKPIVSIHEKGTESEDNPSFNDTPLVPGKKTTNPYMDKAKNYFYDVEENAETPEFNYKIRFNPTVGIKEIKVFYDLDYGIEENLSNLYEPDDDHVLIYQASEATMAKDAEIDRIAFTSNSSLVGRLRENMYTDKAGNDLLKLKPEYFTPYGNYTYIVIWTKDENGKMASQRIKIKLKEHLFDLTDAGFDVQSINSFDITDKSKFNI